MIDLLAVIGLMGVFVVCLTQVGAAATRRSQAQEAADRGAQMADRVVKQLRRDMWAAGGAYLTDDGKLWIYSDEPEPNVDLHMTIWEITGDDLRTLRRTVELSHGEVAKTPKGQSKDGHVWIQQVVHQRTHEDFPVPAAVRFEMATEKFVNPNGWSGAGPVPHAIRLHLGHDDIHLPNRGVFTYGFAVESTHVSAGPIPEIAP